MSNPTPQPLKLNPAEPNTVRVIHLTYTTDENGEMDITFDSEGFEQDPRAVPYFLAATLAKLSEEDN